MPRKRKILGDLPFEEADSAFPTIPFDTDLKWSSPYLSVEDGLWLKNNSDKLAGIVEEFYKYISVGFVYTVKYDQRTGRFLATLVCKNANHAAGASALSFRGSTAFNATVAMAYWLVSEERIEWWLDVGSANQGDFG